MEIFVLQTCFSSTRLARVFAFGIHFRNYEKRLLEASSPLVTQKFSNAGKKVFFVFVVYTFCQIRKFVFIICSECAKHVYEFHEFMRIIMFELLHCLEKIVPRW